jgi:ParB family chromosome partitioning protein
MTPQRGLGRGLSALIPARQGVIDEVDVDLIVPNPEQPRSYMDEDSLQELAASIREHGVLQPLVVSATENAGVYQLVAGERRLRASRIAGLARVPVVIKETAPKNLLELALVENIQRKDLSPLEEAAAYRRLADEFNLTQEQIAERVGKSRSAVANSMRLLGLGEDVQQALRSGAISEGHARTLLAIDDVEMRKQALRSIIDGKLTVRQIEMLVREWFDQHPPPSAVKARARDEEIAAVERRVRDIVGTKVEVRRNARGRGKLVLHFFSDEELEGLLARLGVPAY